MAKTPSTMVPLGITAPDFKLPDVTSGTVKTLAELKSSLGTVEISYLILNVNRQTAVLQGAVDDSSTATVQVTTRLNISQLEITSED